MRQQGFQPSGLSECIGIQQSDMRETIKLDPVNRKIVGRGEPEVGLIGDEFDTGIVVPHQSLRSVLAGVVDDNDSLRRSCLGEDAV